MQRKVILHGKSSLVTSLPSKWAKLNNITKGDSVDVVDRGDHLTISPKERLTKKEAVQNVDGLDRTLTVYTIRGFYRAGFDKLKITFTEQMKIHGRKKKAVPINEIVHMEVQRLNGYEVIDEGHDFFIIENLQKEIDGNFRRAVRRTFLLLLHMVENFQESSTDKKLAGLSSVWRRHDSITKFASYCLRILNTTQQVPSHEHAYYYHIVAKLDRFADVYRCASRDLLSKEKPLSKDVHKICGKTAKAIRLYYELFYSYNTELATQIDNIRYDVEEATISLRNVPVYEIILAANMMNIMEGLLDLIESRATLQPPLLDSSKE